MSIVSPNPNDESTEGSILNEVICGGTTQYFDVPVVFNKSPGTNAITVIPSVHGRLYGE